MFPRKTNRLVWLVAMNSTEDFLYKTKLPVVGREIVSNKQDGKIQWARVFCTIVSDRPQYNT